MIRFENVAHDAWEAMEPGDSWGSALYVYRMNDGSWRVYDHAKGTTVDGLRRAEAFAEARRLLAAESEAER